MNCRQSLYRNRGDKVESRSLLPRVLPPLLGPQPGNVGQTLSFASRHNGKLTPHAIKAIAVQDTSESLQGPRSHRSRRIISSVATSFQCRPKFSTDVNVRLSIRSI